MKNMTRLIGKALPSQRRGLDRYLHGLKAKYLATFCFVVTTSLIPLPAAAVTITVTTFEDELNRDGDCSLREAILAANMDSAIDACPAGSGADTIELPSGTYVLTRLGRDEDLGMTGDLDLRSDLIIRGMGDSPSIIDAARLGDRVFEIRPPDDRGPFGPPRDVFVTLQNLVIANGQAQVGGGIHIDGYFDFHTFDQFFPHTVIDTCTFQGNHATAEGGGLRSSYGGGGGSTLIRNSVFVGNDGGRCGGGIGIFGQHTEIEDSTIDGNTLSTGTPMADGGAGISVNHETVIRRSTVSNNDARDGQGGGIACQNASLIIEDSTISGNISSGQGGGGVIQGLNGGFNPCDVMVESATITRNTGATGGGYFVDAGTATVRNSVIAANATTGTGPDVEGAFVSADHNLIGDATDSTGFTEPNDVTGTTAEPIDPRLGPLADNGGTTGTHALLVGSPAIDSGICGGASDQRGFARPAGNACDRGSVEARHDPAAALFCPTAPVTACETPDRSSLKVRASIDERNRAVRWVWQSANAGGADFGDPTSTTAYLLCIYNQDNLISETVFLPAGKCAGRDCWSAVGKNRGFRFRDRAGDGGSALTLSLKNRAGKVRIEVNSRGSSTLLPRAFAERQAGLTVQIQNNAAEGPACWGTTPSIPAEANAR
jgi:CSLREA domain-containing protein